MSAAAAAASSSSSAGAAACTGAEGGFFFLSGGSAPMGPEEGSAGGLGALAAPSLGCRGRYQLLLSGKALADRYRKIYTAALSDRELGSHPGRYRAPIQQRAGGADTAPSPSPCPRAGLPVPASPPLPSPSRVWGQMTPFWPTGAMSRRPAAIRGGCGITAPARPNLCGVPAPGIAARGRRKDGGEETGLRGGGGGGWGRGWHRNGALSRDEAWCGGADGRRAAP